MQNSPWQRPQIEPRDAGHYTNGNMAAAGESLRNLCLQNLLRYPHLIENGFEDLPLEIIKAVLHSSIRSYSLTTFKRVLKFWPMRVVMLRGNSHLEEEGQFVGKAVAEYIPERDETDTVQEIDIRERDLGEWVYMPLEPEVSQRGAGVLVPLCLTFQPVFLVLAQMFCTCSLLCYELLALYHHISPPPQKKINQVRNRPFVSTNLVCKFHPTVLEN